MAVDRLAINPIGWLRSICRRARAQRGDGGPNGRPHFFAHRARAALRANGLDGGHAPAGIALMAGEAAWACLMRGRPARHDCTPSPRRSPDLQTLAVAFGPASRARSSTAANLAPRGEGGWAPRPMRPREAGKEDTMIDACKDRRSLAPARLRPVPGGQPGGAQADRVAEGRRCVLAAAQALERPSGRQATHHTIPRSAATAACTTWPAIQSGHGCRRSTTRARTR